MRYLGILAILAFVAAPALGDWPHPIKWDQLLPLDTYAAASWIDYDTPSDAQTADDYYCDGLPQDQFITDLEFYGFSYYGMQYIDKFRVSFFTDMPGTPSDTSHPGTLLYQYEVTKADPNDPLKIGWQGFATTDPNFYGFDRYKIDLPESYWFNQGVGAPHILWVSIQGVMVTDGYFDAWYWAFRNRTYQKWGDDAAFTSTYFGYPPWANWGVDPNGAVNIYDGLLPAGWTSLDMSFRLTAFPEPTGLLLLGLGSLLLRRR